MAFPVKGDVTEYTVSPDGEWAVFLADKDTDEVFELYSVPVDDSLPPRRLNGNLPPGGDVEGNFLVTNDSSRVVYRSDELLNNNFRLYTVPIDGSQNPRRLGQVTDLLPGPFQIDKGTIRKVSRDDVRVVGSTLKVCQHL